MPRRINPLDPMGWATLAFHQQALALGAAETIARRMTMMGSGTLSGVEATAMMFEKPAAFAKGMERAAIAATKGQNPSRVMTEFLKPISASAGSNARRLRK
jgi:hypothetical protein